MPSDGTATGDLSQSVQDFLGGVAAVTLSNYQRSLTGNAQSQPGSTTPASSPASGKTPWYKQISPMQWAGVGLAVGLIMFLILRRRR